MSEAIIACENACTLFNWINDSDNATLVASFVALLASILATLTAMLVAFVAYPRQKAIDREHDLHAERRAIYRRFTTIFHDGIGAVRAGAEDHEIGSLYREFKKAYTEIMVSAPDDVVVIATELRAKYSEVLDASENENSDSNNLLIAVAEAEGKFFRCMAAMRADSFHNTNVTSELFSEQVADRIEELRQERLDEKTKAEARPTDGGE